MNSLGHHTLLNVKCDRSLHIFLLSENHLVLFVIINATDQDFYIWPGLNSFHSSILKERIGLWNEVMYNST